MQRLLFFPTALALALASGCSTPSQHEGNPFDERLAAPERMERRSSAVVASPNRPDIQPILSASVGAPSRAETLASTPPAAVAIPAQIGSYEPSSISHSEHGSPVSDSAHAAMQEARRLGAIGDQAGMLELMQQSAFMGNYDALYELARIYQNGIGVQRDMPLAIAYLTTADGHGHAEASRVLAWNYLMGNGVPPDRQYALMLFDKAKDRSPRALREYGMLLTNQLQPGLNDLDRGISLLRQAADAGDAEASFRLGEALMVRGQTSEADAAKALAVARGFTPPTLATEPVKLTQLGAKADVSAEALKQKALAGDNDAIFRYANGLLLGKYPSIDAEHEAYCWFSVAHERGHPQAKAELMAIQGVRALSESKSPGRMDACISDLLQAVVSN